MMGSSTCVLFFLTFAVGHAAAQESAHPSTTDPPREEWNSVTDALRGHEWADQTNNLLDIVRIMPDSLYAFTPLDGMRSFNEVVGHIANVQFYFCDLISDRTGPDRPDLEATVEKSAALTGLMSTIEACDAVFDQLTDVQLVADRARVADNITTMMGHTRRETGKLVTYLRLAGVTPPEIQYYAGRKWRN